MGSKEYLNIRWLTSIESYDCTLSLDIHCSMYLKLFHMKRENLKSYNDQILVTDSYTSLLLSFVPFLFFFFPRVIFKGVIFSKFEMLRTCFFTVFSIYVLFCFLWKSIFATFAILLTNKMMMMMMFRRAGKHKPWASAYTFFGHEIYETINICVVSFQMLTKIKLLLLLRQFTAQTLVLCCQSNCL